MNLYDNNGYVNIGAIYDLNLPFNFMWGGRGTGKTYTSLKSTIERGEVFFLLRRTQQQIDLIGKPQFSPLKRICLDCGWNIISETVGKNNVAFYRVNDGEKEEKPLGYAGALSTISNIRGFDASDVERMIFDEFIPEPHERPIKNEGAAFLNAYETINRNRELKGANAVQVMGLANANNMANAIFLELGLVGICDKMLRKGHNAYIDNKRGIGLFSLSGSPISAQKQQTALYKLTGGSDFEKMAISNDFAERDYRNIKNYPLAEFLPVVFVGELAIYRHKSKNFLYVAAHRSGVAPEYGSGSKELLKFRRLYGFLRDAMIRGEIIYQEVYCEILLTKYLN